MPVILRRRHAVGLAVLLAVPAPAALASLPDTLAPESLQRGQRAVVRTVFAGTQVDSFEAEIVGVMPGGRTEGTLVLGRALTDRVIHTGVAQGMSGSPVFVNGRLVGALSSAFSFSRDPLFGITPIGEMLEVWNHPDGPSNGDPSTGPSGVEPAGASAPPRFRELSWEGDEADAVSAEGSDGAGRAESSPSATPFGTPTQLPIPVSCGGLHPALTELATRWLSPMGLTVVPGGRSRPETSAAPVQLEPGSSVAVELLRGDLNFAAIGTLTWRDGDRVLLFGHPFFQSGDVRMPLATAEIATVVASQQLSFKLGQSGREVGAVLQDRRTAVSGRLGVKAHMLPVGIGVRGAGSRPVRFEFESIEDRALAPIVIGLATVNSLLESGGTGGTQTVRWTLTMARKGARPLVLSDVVASDNPVTDVASALSSPLRFLFANPFSRLALDSVDVALAVEPGRQAWTVRSARVIEPVVRPGGEVHVACDLERWRGERVTRVVTLTVPEEAPDGRYPLWVGGGAELARFEAGRLPGRYRVTSLDDAWTRLQVTRPSDALYVALSAKAPEVNADGFDYPELPQSAVSLLANDRSAPDRGRRGDLAWLDERRLPVPGQLRGELTLTVVVDSHGMLGQPTKP
jgi:hypothetical protein